MLITAITIATAEYHIILEYARILAGAWRIVGRGKPIHRHIIVTDNPLPHDIIGRYHLEEIIAPQMLVEGKLNIGIGINAALKTIEPGTWVCRLDCDTILPANLLELINNPQPDTLYSTPLRWCDEREYELLLDHIYKLNDPNVDPKDYPKYNEIDCTRTLKTSNGGYFQLFNYDGKIRYPETTERGEDYLFAKKWNRRQIINNCYSIHLGEPGLYRTRFGADAVAI